MGGWPGRDDDGWKGLEIVRSGRRVVVRDGEISTLGVGGERLTADNQLGRQSDSKEMMESITIFQLPALPPDKERISVLCPGVRSDMDHGDH